MTGTPEGQLDDPRRRGRRRWSWPRAGWLGRLRWGAGPARGRRLLFLDDDPGRAERFLKDHPQAVWVTNVPDCLARLAGPWDEVHLDHDLGGKMYVDSSDADCGMEVIRWLRKEPRPHLREARFFVHTHNATAGLLMVLLMRGGGYQAEFRPFGLDLQELLAHNEIAANEPERPALRARLLGSLRSLRARLRIVREGEPPAEPMPAARAGPRPPGECDVPPYDPGPLAGSSPEVGGSAPTIQPPPRTRSS